MGTRAGMEVPIIGTDSIKFIDISVPHDGDADLSITTSAAAASITITTSLIEDYASSSIIGDPPLYFIWRIHKSQPNTLELLQLCANKDFPGTTGLRITFPHAFCPFAYVCQNQNQIDAWFLSCKTENMRERERILERESLKTQRREKKTQKEKEREEKREKRKK